MLITRRDFLKIISVGSLVSLFPELIFSNSLLNDNIPFIDYHVHLTRNFTVEKAIEIFKESDRKLGIVAHPGTRYGFISNDESLLKYIEWLKPYPVFVGLQPVDVNWHKQFSSETLAKLDYVLMDALEIPNVTGGYDKVWQPDFEVIDQKRFIKKYIDFTVEILENEKLNILANPTFLPKCLEHDYDKIRTKKLMNTIIYHTVKNNVALEINSMYQYPKPEFITLAKRQGAKFTFGSNGRTPDEMQDYSYCFNMVKECKLTKDDFFNYL